MNARHISLGDLMEPADHPDVAGRDTFGRGRLSTAANQAARDQARLQASQQAVASEVIAFQVIQQRAQLASGAEVDPARVAASLSAREREVIGLVAAGRTDGEIATELFISKKTASVHVANIKSKLGASSRVEIAMLAAMLHLVADGVAPADGPDRRAVPADPAVVCPFKGLASFDVGDGGYFFGRERVIAELVARLAATTFVAVVGPSGSGKSSVVKAGLARALRAGVLPGSDDWRLAVLRPGDHPLDALGRALGTAMRDADPVDDEHPAEEWLDRLPTGGRLVVIVDQFEEAYTVCRDPQERAQFLDRLAVLARGAERRALVAIAIRSEFYGRCAEHREIADLASTSTVLLGPMSADELTRAIELPARAAGLRMDTTLVPALVTEVLQQPGGLPMLSSTLLELWQRRDGRSLRMETYRGLGGISGAVARVAETAFSRLSPEDQGIARSIFLRLATVGDNGVASRRRVPIGEIDGGRSADVARVMAVLVDGRLLTVDDGYVEPAHEALLREWPRMRQWLDDDAQARRIREHLVGSAREWDGTGRERSELYRGQRLSAALEWASTRRDELNDVERAFLDSSQEASEADLAGQRRINMRLRGLLGAVAALLVVALVAGTLALRQADAARTLADDARTSAETARTAADDARAYANYARVRELGASSRTASLSDATLGRLLAVAAANLHPPDLATEAILHQAWQDDAVVQRFAAPDGRPPGLLANVDAAGTRVAEVWGHDGDEGSLLEVVDLASGESLWKHGFSAPSAVLDQAFFSLDESQVVTSVLWISDEDHAAPSGELGIFVFDAVTGKQIRHIDMGACGTLLTGVSAAGYLVVGAPEAAPVCYGSDVRPHAFTLVDPASGATRFLVDASSGDAMVSRNGKVLAYSTEEGIAAAVDLPSGRERFRVDATTFPQGSGAYRAISADGGMALFGNTPPIVLSTKTGVAINALQGGSADSTGQAFGLAGDLAYTSGGDAVVRVWDAREGAQLFALPGVHGQAVLPSADGRVVAVDTAEGNLTVTDPRPRGEAGVVRSCGGISAGQLKVIGTMAFVGSNLCASVGNVLYGIDLTVPEVVWTGKDMDGQHLAVSLDGTRVARQTSGTMGLEIDDAATGRMLVRLEGTCTWNSPDDELRDRAPGCKPFPNAPFPFWANDLQFAPDGSVVVGLDSNKYLVVWDPVTGHMLNTIQLPAKAAGFLFTPDGREILVGTGTGGDKAEMLAYSTASWELQREVPVDESVEGRLTPIGFVDGGRTLVTVGGLQDQGAGWVHRLDASTFKVLETKPAHTARLKAAAVSPDGTQIATAAADGTVRVWDAKTLELEHELRVAGQAQGVAFVDEQHLAVTPAAGNVLLMILDRDELLAKVRSTLTRGFTEAECEQFGFGSACPTLEQLRGGPNPTP